MTFRQLVVSPATVPAVQAMPERVGGGSAVVEPMGPTQAMKLSPSAALPQVHSLHQKLQACSRPMPRSSSQTSPCTGIPCYWRGTDSSPRSRPASPVGLALSGHECRVWRGTGLWGRGARAGDPTGPTRVLALFIGRDCTCSDGIHPTVGPGHLAVGCLVNRVVRAARSWVGSARGPCMPGQSKPVLAFRSPRRIGAGARIGDVSPVCPCCGANRGCVGNAAHRVKPAWSTRSGSFFPDRQKAGMQWRRGARTDIAPAAPADVLALCLRCARGDGGTSSLVGLPSAIIYSTFLFLQYIPGIAS